MFSLQVEAESAEVDADDVDGQLRRQRRHRRPFAFRRQRRSGGTAFSRLLPIGATKTTVAAGVFKTSVAVEAVAAADGGFRDVQMPQGGTGIAIDDGDAVGVIDVNETIDRVEIVEVILVVIIVLLAKPGFVGR